MSCDFCGHGPAKTYKLFGGDMDFCEVCARLNGTQHGQVSNRDVLYAIVQLFHALDVQPKDDEE